MDKFDRIYAVHNILSRARYPVARVDIENKLECKRATVGRTIAYMQEFLGAPIKYDAKLNGWYYDKKAGEHPYELPGLWFNAHELQALATLSQLLGDLQPGLLEEQLRPFQKRIQQLLDNKQFGKTDFTKAIRLLGIGVRNGGEHFQKVAEAVLQRKQLSITYHSRTDGLSRERVISPQRIIRYRDNWYLDAYCHLRNELRNFAIDRIKAISPTDEKAKHIKERELDEYFAESYGIFAGKSDKTAVLHFTPYRARWVAEETWHPKQQGQFLENGHYELRIPYGKAEELIMDILKYGPDVEVIEPQSLREAVEKRLLDATAQYKVGAFVKRE